MSFTEGASVNEEDLPKPLQVFEVPQAGIDTIRSRMAMNIYDEYANLLHGRGMYDRM
jgi:hypothetical protein